MTEKKMALEIMNACLDLIVEIGLNEVTTAKIAQRVNTSENTIYRNFKNKQDLIEKTLLRCSKELLISIENIQQKDISAVEKISEIIEFHLDYNMRHSGISRLAFSEQIHLSDLSLRDVSRDHIQKYENILAQILLVGIEQKEIRSDLDVNMAAQNCIGLIFYSVHKWSINNFSYDLRDEKEKFTRYLEASWT